MSEPDLVRERYLRRRKSGEVDRWQQLDPSVWLMVQEKERGLIRALWTWGIWPLDDKRVLDVGCGGGGDLLLFVRLGFDPANLIGCELLEERAADARRRVPAGVTVKTGDALDLSFEPESFDIVLQSTVFTSLLDERFRERLAARMWSLVRPGGAVLWFDFAYDNPRNPDVRGVRLARVRTLFPEGELRAWRVVLAPPLARAVTRIHPALYGVLGAIPLLRTHLVCRITKPQP